MTDGPATGEETGPATGVYDRGDAVCVIGGGSSGLAAVKNLREHGFEVDCYERETGLGGAWNAGADRSPVYAGLHLVSSRPFTQFPDFPMPDSYPDYPDHRQVLAYFERYADHFELREHVWFGTEVQSVAATGGDRWEVTVRGTGGGPTRTLRYAAVVVANGHLWHPHRPEYPGQEDFGGQIIHSSAYKDPSQLRGKRVLVVGGGNSGCDIAVAAAQSADTTWHSTRRGDWLTPKYLLGRPADQLDDLTRALRLPLWARRLLYRTVLRLTVGRPARFGLRRPEHKPFTAHPVVTSQLIYHLGHGDLTPKPDVAEFQPGRVVFTDGSSVDPQLVVMATGYRPRFDFLADEYLGGDGERPRLFLHMLNPAYPTLSVAGLIDPDSGQFGLVHWQTVLIARLLRARVEAPSRAATLYRRAERDIDRRYLQTRMLASGRHRYDVGHHRYLAALGQALSGLEGAK
ncbi:flavin-containing monooxygenase [Actinocatenispora rupis]|uniref:Flavin-binding monooxygenase n=1 Tax=Actinocatenispora rupis TaxID=519421 RepID=A0A8J3ND80_9ACTN|nr:NAD(P)-binding domain-containing protein [Actinocatenispora rupis]GID14796.1 flavin-binding monooxygenase [Actinocatenispora rupis]